MTPDPASALETVAVGPAVRRPADAVRAVAFYGANPAAAPRPGRLDRALWGVGQVLRAARLVATDRALRRAALVPTLLTVAGCAALAAASTALHARDGVESRAATFHAFLVAFVALASMPPTLLQRMWLRVAHEARRALGLAPGEDPFPGERYPVLLWREAWKAVRQAAVVSVGIVPALWVVRLLGRTESAALAAAWAFYWVVVDAFELPVELLPGPRHGGPEPWFSRLLMRAAARSRWLAPAGWLGRFLRWLSRPWVEELRFTERHRWETAGLGAAVGAVLALPVVGLCFRAVAIVAATALHGRLEPSRREG